MAELRGFRFGVIGEDIGTCEGLVGEARRAEALGYSTLLLCDHFVSEPFGAQFAPMVARRHARPGQRLPASRAPGKGGRDPRRAVGRAATFQGDHYSVADLTTFPVPVQRPHPPILVGAGSRRMLGIAGRHADIVNILPKALPNGTISEDLSERSAATVARKIEWVREAAGERFDELELSMICSVAIGEDARQAAERLTVERGWGAAAAEPALDMPSVLAGPVERIVDELLARR
jgi:alkanesulfonate monooxygenase SsuD/methylene tetrahydromethanopterin reductase-like flavin-dependent oxidoreductase (luciferase family)